MASWCATAPRATQHGGAEEDPEIVGDGARHCPKFRTCDIRSAACCSSTRVQRGWVSCPQFILSGCPKVDLNMFLK